MSALVGYLMRATGIVAAVLGVAALVWGFFFSARATGHRLRPAWWLDLHNWLGGLALTFAAVHVATAWADSGSGIGLLQVLVPGTASGDRLGIGAGVVAVYLFAVAVFTTWPRRLKNRSLWRVLHLGSVAGAALALWHTYLSGSDASRVSMKVGIVIASAVGTYALGLRLFSLIGARRRQSRSKGAAASNSQRAHSEN